MSGYLKNAGRKGCCPDCAAGPCDDCAEACCLYPWPADGALYPDTDLPAAVEYGGDTLSHSGAFQFTGTTYYIVSGAGSWELRLVADDSLVQEQVYLICRGVTDQFHGNYSVGGVKTIIRTHAGSCEWLTDNFTDTDCTGLGPGEYAFALNYTNENRWELLLVSNESPDMDDPDYPDCTVATNIKDGDQSSPEGTYNGAFGEATIS